MRTYLLIFCLVLLPFVFFGQAPALHFQKPIGGSLSDNMEGPNSISGKIHLKTNRGNTIVAGTTLSNDGDIAGNKGKRDIFVGELDSNKQWVWKKTYGGSEDDYLMSIQPGIDSGYVVLGTTSSNNGDVTANHGNTDMWVLRIGNVGETIWNKCYGGSAPDEGAYLTKVGDSGYVFIGTARSNDGDVSGVHVTPSDTSTYLHGDIWIVRIDPLGQKVWAKTYGGSSYLDDFGTIIKPSPFGGFICGGVMQSFDGEGAGNHGRDIWLAKLNSQGNIEWSRCYGDVHTEYLGDIEVSTDGYAFAGCTNSNSGDVSGNHNPFRAYDAWFVRIAPNGTILSQKCFGGSGDESIEDFVPTADGKWLIAGYKNSTDGDFPVNKGGYDAFIAKVSNAGVVEWQKSFGGTSDDFALNILGSSDNEFLVLAETSSTTNDVVGNHGQNDIWLAEFGNASEILGTVFFDANGNSVKDPAETFANGMMVVATKPNYSQGSITQNGLFRMSVGIGSYETKVLLNLPYYNVVPAARNTTFASYFQKDSFSFALQPIPNKQDLQMSILPLTPARPGFETSYRLLYKNKGTTVINSGSVILKKDSRLVFVTAVPVPSYNTGDSLRWNFGPLNPNDSASILLGLKVAAPPTVNNGDSLVLWSFIEPVAGDETPADDTAYLKQRVVGSFDPNDKTEAQGGLIEPSFVQKGSHLQYLIRFQNTGTDTAFTVVVRDTLDSRVDVSSLEMLSASHSYMLNVENGVNLTWRFNNIRLVDSLTNERSSHGYIAYRIKPKTTVVAGERIHNTASIYFDYNLPVLTNDALTLVRVPVVALPQGLINFFGSRKQAGVHLAWQVAGGHTFLRFAVERYGSGGFLKIGEVAATVDGTRYDFVDLMAPQGTLTYRLRLIQPSGREAFSSLLFIREERGSNVLSVYPNPTTAQTQVTISSIANGLATLRVSDKGGRIVLVRKIPVQTGTNTYLLNGLESLPKGLYTVEFTLSGQILTERLVVQ